MKTENAREEVGEEASGFSQEGALGLHPSKLLEDGEGDDFRIGESLEGFVVLPFGVEVSVGVVYFAEQGGERLFQEEKFWSMLCLGHPMLLWSGLRVAFVLPHKPRNTHLEEAGMRRWLLVRGDINEPEEVAFYLAYAPAGTSAQELARTAGKRWKIEETFEQAKGESGLDE